MKRSVAVEGLRVPQAAVLPPLLSPTWNSHAPTRRAHRVARINRALAQALGSAASSEVQPWGQTLAGLPTPAPRKREPHANRSSHVLSASKAEAPAADIKAGVLVEYEKDGKGNLALVHSPDGKKNWWLLTAAGRRVSVQPKQISLVLPGTGYNEEQLRKLFEEVQADKLDLSLLEIAFEIAADEARPLTLQELSELLFEDASYRSLYTTHRMLTEHPIYFRQVSKSPTTPTYEARPAEFVAAAKAREEEEARLKAELSGWQAAVKAARQAPPAAAAVAVAAAAVGGAAGAGATATVAQQWLEGPYGKRIAAIRQLALSPPASLGHNSGGSSPAASSPSSFSSSSTASSSSNGPLDASTLQLAVDSIRAVTPATGSASASVDAEAAAGLLIELGVLRLHEPLGLLRRGLELPGFSEALEAEAKALLASPPPDPDASTRLDLTHLNVFTIDDEGTTEVDDGLSVETLPDGRTRLWVHVADPTRWLLVPGGPLDLEARSRGRTLYFPFGMRPMFPEQLAVGLFSLRDGQVCEAMSVGVVLGPSGRLTDPIVTPTRIRVTHKLTYNEADAAIMRGDSACPYQELISLRDAASLRRMYREACGCIEIPLPEAKVVVPESQLDARRPKVTITRISQWESVSRSLVAEMMIMAGEAIGEIGAAADLPLPYRGQDTPDLPPVSELNAIPEGPCRGYALKRCMTRSTVTGTPQRHASLALNAYVQFTSPIRRYSDIMAHFQIKTWLRNQNHQPPSTPSASNQQPLAYNAQQINDVMTMVAERGRELGAAEREAESYWIVEYLAQQRDRQYGALMLGWFRKESRLAAVLLDDLGLEVVVRVDERCAPGDTLVVAASELNPITGFYRFTTVGYTSVAAYMEEESDESEESEEESEGKEGQGQEEMVAGEGTAGVEGEGAADGGESK